MTASILLVFTVT